ncbi:hypothetical protein Lser_V15G34015 [Lactuca serriola]
MQFNGVPTLPPNYMTPPRAALNSADEQATQAVEPTSLFSTID